METVALTLGSLAVGVVATWFWSRFYYVRASRQLVEETAKLRKMVNILGLALEQAGYFKIKRDKYDNIDGIILDLSGRAEGSSRASGDLTKYPPDE